MISWLARENNPSGRRVAGWCGMYVAVAAAVLAVAGCGAASAAAAASAASVRAPVCASNENAYLPLKAGSPASGGAQPVVPGRPAAAVICRYGDNVSDTRLASSLKVTDKSRLAQLQSALNESWETPGGIPGCGQSDGKSAVILIAYPGQADRVAFFDRWCERITVGSATYTPSVKALDLVASWTGKW